MKNKKFVALIVTVLSLSTFLGFNSKETYASSSVSDSAVTASLAQQVQLVSGKVTNKNTGSPISGVTVAYKNNKGKTYTAKTNASGIYKINVPASRYSITVNYVGYKAFTQSFTISNNKMLKTFNIQLAPANTEGKLTMVAEKSSYPVTANSINVIFKNNTKKDSGYGLLYTIEFLKGNTWVKVPLDFSVNMIYKTLKPGQSRTEAFSLFQDQYKYQPGKYRIKNGDNIAEFTLTAVQQANSITMTADKSSYPVNSQSIKVIIKNGTTKESGYGYDYSIEYFNGKSWQKVPLEFAVIAIYLILKPGETKTETINLYQDQYKYVAGKYRVVKNIDGKELTAEFTLK